MVVRVIWIPDHPRGECPPTHFGRVDSPSVYGSVVVAGVLRISAFPPWHGQAAVELKCAAASSAICLVHQRAYVFPNSLPSQRASPWWGRS